jgi:hypothetical protein
LLAPGPTHRRGSNELTHSVTRPLDSTLVGDTISAMPKKDSAASRRRSKPRLGRKTFVYFTDEERKQVDEAAKFERRSISSFVANAALVAAEEVRIRHNLKK